MALYVRKKIQSNKLTGNDSFEGVSLEKELRLAQTQGIKPDRNITEIFYTQKKDGVLPSCDIRTDRFDLAQNAMEKVNKTFHEKIQEQITKQLEKQEKAE